MLTNLSILDYGNQVKKPRISNVYIYTVQCHGWGEWPSSTPIVEVIAETVEHWEQ